MARILLTGATGVLGQELKPRLLRAGHDVRSASRSPPKDGSGPWVELDLIDGTGVSEAVADVDVIVHAASDARGDSEAVDVHGTERLLEAAEAADIDNFLYVSIVGIDEIPFSYYENKLQAERTIEASSVPSTVIRSTQFHPFVAYVLYLISRLPLWPLPTAMQLQPIDTGEAADQIANYAIAEAAGRVPDIGGPEVATLGELAKGYRQHRGLRRPIMRVPWPGSLVAAFRAGNATCPNRDVGTITWEEWLAEQGGTPGKGVY